MKRLSILIIAILALSGFMAATVSAQSPHFVGKVTATLTGNNVQVCFKEAGLGNNQTINYEATASATATYVCVNNGGQCPNAANKTTVNGPVSAVGTFNSGDNGTISQCLTFTPPSAGAFSCPGGQNLRLSDVSYSSITIKDTTNTVQKAATPTGLAATPFTCP